jgi:putative flippase GtrA
MLMLMGTVMETVMAVEVQESMLEFVLFIKFLIDMGIVFVVGFVLTSNLCW